MRKNTESMMKGAALGLLAGGAVGAAGAYVAQKNPKEMKKMMKKEGEPWRTVPLWGCIGIGINGPFLNRTGNTENCAGGCPGICWAAGRTLRNV